VLGLAEGVGIWDLFIRWKSSEPDAPSPRPRLQSSLPERGDTSLGALYESLALGGGTPGARAALAAAGAALPALGHTPGFDRYAADGDGANAHAHEAGADAYMTGAVFACLARMEEAGTGGSDAALAGGWNGGGGGNGNGNGAALAASLDAPPAPPAPGLGTFDRPSLAPLAPLLGRLNLTGSDIPYAALSSEDAPTPERAHVLYVRAGAGAALPFRGGGELARALDAALAAQANAGDAGPRRWTRATLVDGGVGALVELLPPGGGGAPAVARAAAAAAALAALLPPGARVGPYAEWAAAVAARRAAAAPGGGGGAGARPGKRPRLEAAPAAEGGAGWCAIM
jgi:hypothetical protein